jgi:ankyrin repeat protein
MMLDLGARLYNRDDYNRTALAHACSGGHAELVTLLLSKKPQDPSDLDDWDDWLHAADDDGKTALHLAVERCEVGCVQALVDAGFNVNISDRDRTSALLYADDVEIVRILLDAGAEDLRNEKDDSAASLACENPARIEVLRLILQRFPDTDHADYPLLSFAASVGNLEAVRLLVSTRPPGYVNVRNACGLTELLAVDRPEMVRLLLELGADPRIVDNAGKTPLMRHHNAVCARLLLDAAPDLVGARDLQGRTAVMHLSCCDGQHVAPALEELFRYCEEHGIDAEVNGRADNGDTALHVAMVRGDLRAVKLLLEQGADMMSISHDGTTVLMKPFLARDVLGSTYEDIRMGYAARYHGLEDAQVSKCLKTLLDTVLLYGVSGTETCCEAQDD